MVYKGKHDDTIWEVKIFSTFQHFELPFMKFISSFHMYVYRQVHEITRHNNKLIHTFKCTKLTLIIEDNCDNSKVPTQAPSHENPKHTR